MELLEQVKSMTQEQIAGAMLRLLTHVSPETFVTLTLLASRLVEGGISSAAVAAVKESLREGEKGQATRMFRRVMTELSPHCLTILARNLFINGLLRSSRLRADFERKNGFSPPFTVLISPTMQCNLQCTGCYSGRYVREKGLSFQLLDRILGRAHSMGSIFIVFSGGEPLTRKDELLRLVEKYDDMYFMFYTNGTLISEQVADELYPIGKCRGHYEPGRF